MKTIITALLLGIALTLTASATDSSLASQVDSKAIVVETAEQTITTEAEIEASEQEKVETEVYFDGVELEVEYTEVELDEDIESL